jgi:ribose 5-phosphate isomerase B
MDWRKIGVAKDRGSHRGAAFRTGARRCYSSAMSFSPNAPIAHPPIALGADHAGLVLKDRLAAALAAAGRDVLDLGTHATASVDYPDYAHAVARAVLEGRAAAGILVCGSGIGMSIAANRHPGIRCALAHDVTSAILSRRHNDANILALGERLIGVEVALAAMEAFLNTPFEGGRHARRLGRIELSGDDAPDDEGTPR